MRLATITNWAYGATVALTLASGTTMLLASSAQQQERTSVSQRYALDRATATIEEDVLALSELSRQYIINGDASDLLAYEKVRAELGSRLIDQSQKMTVAASAIAEKKTVGHRS